MGGRSLVLASASQIRATLLRRNGVPLEVMPARVDEEALKRSMLAANASPRDIADGLAEMKARRIAERLPGALVLGVDQVLVQNGEIFDKTPDLNAAREQLKVLRGHEHELLSAAVVYEDTRPVWRHVGQVRLRMRDFSDSFLESYIARHGDGLLATVGCYKLEEDGASLFSAIRGDYFSVLGLPLLEVLQFLRTRGVVPE